MVTVMFSSDDNHAMLLGVALCSLFENKKGNYEIALFVMDGGISVLNKERLRRLEERYGFTITYVVPDPHLFVGISTAARSIAAYYRVAMARSLPPACQKVIYLDCDVLIEGDVEELFNIDLGEKTIGAVADHPQPERRQHLKDISGKESGYFNSGVLVIDMLLWKKHDIEKKLFDYIHNNPDKLEFADQDPLNVVLLDDWQELPVRYNFMPVPTNLANDDHPFIVHFAGGIKPWYFLSALPHHQDYRYYVNKTPWKNKKYRKFMDTPFAKKYHIYPVAWWLWGLYKKIK